MDTLLEERGHIAQLANQKKASAGGASDPTVNSRLPGRFHTGHLVVFDMPQPFSPKGSLAALHCAPSDLENHWKFPIRTQMGPKLRTALSSVGDVRPNDRGAQKARSVTLGA
jgi:hypothetical protein